MNRQEILLKIKEHQLEIQKLQNKYNEILDKMNIVDAIVALIIDNKYPTELYDSWGSDFHDIVYYIDDQIKVGVVSGYGYTDIVGVTSEEFEQITNKIILNS